MTPTPEPVAEAGGEFVLVPREPTKAMIQASFDSMKPYKFRELTKRKKVQARWAAMLAAAPATSAPAADEPPFIPASGEGRRIYSEMVNRQRASAPAGDVGKLVEWLRKLVKQRRGAFGERGMEGCHFEKVADMLVSLNSRLAAQRIDAENEELRLLRKIEKFVIALRPFSAFAGELFARNWNRADIVAVLDNPGDPHRVTAGDFFEARAALSPTEPAGRGG